MPKKKKFIKEITPKILNDLYVKQGLSSDKIGEMYGCGGQTILNYLHHYKIEVRKSSKKCKTKINDKFGKLTVTNIYKEKYDNINHTMCECECECGNKIKLKAQKITQRISCGCLHRQTRENHRDWCGHGEISGGHFSQIRANAELRNIYFNISIEYIWDLFLKQERKCALSGQVLSFYPEKTASLDRKDSSKGYSEENVQWVHKLINHSKMAMTDEQYVEQCYKVCKYKGLF